MEEEEVEEGEQEAVGGEDEPEGCPVAEEEGLCAARRQRHRLPLAIARGRNRGYAARCSAPCRGVRPR